MAEIARHSLAHDFRAIDPTEAQVILLEGGPRILPAWPVDLAQDAERALRTRGVEVRTGAKVTRITADAVYLGDSPIATQTALWTAGVTASPLGRSLGVPLDRGGRVQVEVDLTLAGHPEVYVVGDLARFEHTPTGRPLPGVAQVAVQQGHWAAENIWRTSQGKPSRPFQYRDPGSMAIFGRGAAVANLGRVHLAGRLAWLVWALVHVGKLIDFDNRLLVLAQWAWSYVTWQRGSRLITRTTPPESTTAEVSHASAA